MLGFGGLLLAFDPFASIGRGPTDVPGQSADGHLSGRTQIPVNPEVEAGRGTAG
jgi:hypothetical protein